MNPMLIPRAAARTRLSLLLILALTLAMMVAGGHRDALADNHVTIDPNTNDLVLNEGDTFEETITVTVPEGSGVAAADVYFLMDTTGSMGGPISSLKAAASDVMNELVTTFPEVDLAFGAGDFKDFPSDPYAFRHQVSLTGDTAAVQAGINAWSASGGGDGPEGQFYAFDQLAEDRAPSNDGSPAGTIGWRPEAKSILVTFGDAPSHDPVCSAITATVSGHAVPYDITEGSVTAKLVDAGITFIGISTTTGTTNGMDGTWPAYDYTACGTPGGTTMGPGQASRIAEATGGVHLINVAAADIANAVKAEVSTAVQTIDNLRLVPTGDTAAFVTAIDPATGYGPLNLEEENVLPFEVDWEGVVAATDTDQVFTGTIDVVADGSVVAHKTVTITVPGETVIPPGDGECVDLIAAQHEVAGELCVDNDGDNLTVTYTTVDGWEMTETHLHVADDADDVPQNRRGNPQVGHFEHSGTHDPNTTEVVYTISLADLDADADDVLTIAAHAVVERDEGGEELRAESAWGDGERFVERGNWAMHFDYTVK